jgi:hypothetical protein
MPAPQKQGVPPPPPNPPADPKPATCGQLNVFLTGLSGYHPLVAAQGFDPAVIDATLRADHQRIIDAGYNCRCKSHIFPWSQVEFSDHKLTASRTVSLFGPEKIDDLKGEISDVRFDGVGVGAGVRASVVPELTIHLESRAVSVQSRLRSTDTKFRNPPSLPQHLCPIDTILLQL